MSNVIAFTNQLVLVELSEENNTQLRSGQAETRSTGITQKYEERDVPP